MEVIKNKLQINPQLSTLNLSRYIYSKEGIRGFYRGYLLSQLVFVPYTITFFVSYEYLKKSWVNYNSHDIGFGGYLACASLSATLAGAVTNPLDVTIN
jgi:solute carrier family 25 S-adenosylmethionine transporter 26